MAARSIATAFMRLSSPSIGTSEVISVHAVAVTAIAVNIAIRKVVSCSFWITSSIMMPPSRPSREGEADFA